MRIFYAEKRPLDVGTSRPALLMTTSLAPALRMKPATKIQVKNAFGVAICIKLLSQLRNW